MANGGRKNNNGEKEIELLPEELRRPEERKKKKEEKPEVKLFVPPKFVAPGEEKPKGPTIFEKIFGTKEEREKRKQEKEARRVEKIKKQKEEKAALEILKMKAVTKSPEVAPKPKAPPAVVRLPSSPEIKAAPKILPGVKPLGPEATILPKRKFGITLMPAELVERPEIKRTKQMTILVIIILILGAILAVSFGILKWQDAKVVTELKRVEANLAAINQQIKNLEERKNQAQILQRQLKAASKLLDQHIYWTNVFDFLEKNVIADVYFSNFIGANDGFITMSAVAKSYKALAKQIVVFQTSEQIDKVSITSASASVDPMGKILEVNFDAKLKLKPDVLLK